MKINCLQLDIQWEDKPANYRTVKYYLERARPPSGSLLLLPEMFATGFSMNVPAIVEAPDGPTERFLGEIAREFDLFVIGGLVGQGTRGAGLNQAVAFDPSGAVLARYSKNYPFTLGGESQHYDAGKEISLFDWRGCAVAPMVCYDLRFPELFRSAVRRGAQLYAVIANWPNMREDHWITLLRARAIENQAYVAGVNRCGRSPDLVYPGRSLIIDPHGKIIADAGNGEAVISAEVDLPMLNQWRRDFPALADMR